MKDEAAGDDGAQTQELRVFLGWPIVIAVVAALSDLVLYAFVREPVLLVLSACSLAGLLGMLAARTTLRRGGPQRAVYVTVGVMLGRRWCLSLVLLFLRRASYSRVVSPVLARGASR